MPYAATCVVGCKYHFVLFEATDEVPKVPKGCSEGFCHFWHLVTLGFSRNTQPRTQLIVGIRTIDPNHGTSSDQRDILPIGW